MLSAVLLFPLIRGRTPVVTVGGSGPDTARSDTPPPPHPRSPGGFSGTLGSKAYAMSGDSGSSNCSSFRIVPSISAAKESWEKRGDTRVSSNSNTLSLRQARAQASHRGANCSPEAHRLPTAQELPPSETLVKPSPGQVLNTAGTGRSRS